MNEVAAVVTGFGIPLVLALVFGLIGGIRRWMCRDWVRTSGVVINSSTGGLTGFGSMYPTFEWFDQYGNKHRQTSMVRQSFAPQPGTRVSVKYDPQRPYRGMINTFVQNGSIFLVIAGILVVFSLVLGFAMWWMVSVLGTF